MIPFLSKHSGGKGHGNKKKYKIKKRGVKTKIIKSKYTWRYDKKAFFFDVDNFQKWHLSDYILVISVSGKNIDIV